MLSARASATGAGEGCAGFDRSSSLPPMFSCDGLVKRYGRIAALRGVTLAVDPGVVGLLGPNGAGKSTLISILLGQTPATSGKAQVLGLDVRRQQPLIRQRIGFMPENDCLIPGMSGTGYVCYAGRLAGMSHSDAMQRAHEVLDYAELGEARYRPAEEYSAGMKQRLKLAQALVHDPDLLFLDEPTNGMDPRGRLTMLSLIKDLGAAGIAVLLSSHLLPDVERVCERVIIMGAGEILTSGRIDEMRKPHPTLCTVDYVGDGDAFARGLTSRNVGISGPARNPATGKASLPVGQPTGRRIAGADHTSTIAVELPGPGQEALVLEAAIEAGVSIRGLHPKRSGLQETFMAAISKQGPV